jgi:hypothetical protein
MSDRNIPNEPKLNQVTLDFEQRQRAEALVELVDDLPTTAAYELIFLRDQNKELARLLRYAATHSSLAPLMNDSWRDDSLAALDVSGEK